jgi:hypothetical protein
MNPKTTTPRLPDFIIGGAMKCATTSLHEMLAASPEVFIPKREVKYFDLDDIEVHPDNFGRVNGAWAIRNFDRDQQALLDWYVDQFREAAPEQFIGEDSPSYLCSERAPSRIRDLIPDVKLIFMLRDPVARAYSHYWHLVRSGRAFFSFEDTLRHAPNSIIRRGFYQAQLQRYFEIFPREQIHIVVFEDFIKNTSAHLNQIHRFIGLKQEASNEALKIRANVGGMPKYLTLQLWFNLKLRDYVGGHQLTRLPGSPPAPKAPLKHRFLKRLNRFLCPPVRTKHPPMLPETKQFLTQLYREENKRLEEMLGIDLATKWPSFREKFAQNENHAKDAQVVS